jgi:hypothetical protein
MEVANVELIKTKTTLLTVLTLISIRSREAVPQKNTLKSCHMLEGLNTYKVLP